MLCGSAGAAYRCDPGLRNSPQSGESRVVGTGKPRAPIPACVRRAVASRSGVSVCLADVSHPHSAGSSPHRGGPRRTGIPPTTWALCFLRVTPCSRGRVHGGNCHANTLRRVRLRDPTHDRKHETAARGCRGARFAHARRPARSALAPRAGPSGCSHASICTRFTRDCGRVGAPRLRPTRTRQVQGPQPPRTHSQAPRHPRSRLQRRRPC